MTVELKGKVQYFVLCDLMVMNNCLFKSPDTSGTSVFMNWVMAARLLAWSSETGRQFISCCTMKESNIKVMR